MGAELAATGGVTLLRLCAPTLRAVQAQEAIGTQRTPLNEYQLVSRLVSQSPCDRKAHSRLAMEKAQSLAVCSTAGSTDVFACAMYHSNANATGVHAYTLSH